MVKNKKYSSSKIILGIDPGTIRTGYGIVEYDYNIFKPITYGIIKLNTFDNISLKLECIYNELDKIIKTFSPDEFSIETAFYGKNVQSALKIGYARGVSMLAAVHNQLKVNEYSPREIKKSLVGTGAASKEQVNFMVKSILNLRKKEIQFDASDALATAICHAFHSNSLSNISPPMADKKNDWKNFVETFPERVIQ